MNKQYNHITSNENIEICVSETNLFTINYLTDDSQFFGKLTVLFNCVGNSDRRVFDFYKIMGLFNRTMERKNFKKLFSISDKVNFLDQLPKDSVDQLKPKNRTKPHECYLDAYAMRQCIQFLKHHDKFNDEECGRLGSLKEFLADVEEVFMCLCEFYSPILSQAENDSIPLSFLHDINCGRGVYLILLGIINGRIGVMIGKASDFEKRVQQHLRKYSKLKILMCIRNNDELALERAVKQEINSNGGQLLSDESREVFVATTTFDIHLFKELCLNAATSVPGSETISARHEIEADNGSPLKIFVSPVVKKKYKKAVATFGEEVAQDSAQRSLEHTFDMMDLSNKRKKYESSEKLD